MRQIKFRGHEFFSRKYVYSQTIRETDDGFAFWTGDDWLNCTDIEQLIAVDKNGREVFEGDLVVRIADDDDPDFDRAKAFPMAATFDDFSAIINGQIILAEVST